MTQLTNEINKLMKLTELQLVEVVQPLCSIETCPKTYLKIQGIVAYYLSKGKLTEGQRESLIRYIAINKTSN
jgi:hypothetical protein